MESGAMEVEEPPASTVSASVRQFLRARTQELVAISSRLADEGKSENSYTPFKHIPKHLRRRAVSHNIKRLPFRFKPKDVDLSQKKGNPLSFVSSKVVKKVGSRKHRRRKSNLLLEFNRRQRENRWMETHIWHAKRFFMSAKWNCKIPIAPTDKSQRAIYRFTKNYVTLRDISFTSIFQITGNYEEICAGLQELTPSQCNLLSARAIMFSSGEREGKLHIYRRNSYPDGYIGEVTFHWLKQIEGKSILWLWLHPAYSAEILDQLLEIYDLNIVFPPLPKESNDAVKDLTIDEIKLRPRKYQAKKTWTNISDSIILTDLQGELNRLRFTGPQSLAVLKEVLRPTDPTFLSKNSSDSVKSCLKQFLSDSQKFLNCQKLLFEVVDRYENFPAHIVLPLLVRDPRVFLPYTRSKVLLQDDSRIEAFEGNEDDMDADTISSKDKLEVDECSKQEESGGDEIDVLISKFTSISYTPLANTEVRESLVHEKMNDHDFCNRRAGILIPGAEIELGPDENQIPVLLIHRPGSSNAKNFSDGGFDLILPAGWTMAFWIACVYRSARVIGLRDAISCAFETSNLFSPYLLSPDSESGVKEISSERSEKEAQYLKMTPAKRPNLIKLSCCSPFAPDWKGLLQFWQSKETCVSAVSNAFFVLRDCNLLSLLADNVKTKFWRKLVQNLSTINELHRCLIGVSIELTGKGTVEDNAILCLPKASHFAESEANATASALISAEFSSPIQPLAKDIHQSARSQLRERHQDVMGFLRRKRRKLRKANKSCSDEEMKSEREQKLEHYKSSQLSSLYNKKMNDLWFIPPDRIQETYGRLIHKPLGFVTYGGNNYSHGACAGLGYVSAAALVEFAKNAMEDKKLGKSILLRNWATSDIYRPATLRILRI